jgi:hypothetical protein
LAQDSRLRAIQENNIKITDKNQTIKIENRAKEARPTILLCGKKAAIKLPQKIQQKQLNLIRRIDSKPLKSLQKIC